MSFAPLVFLYFSAQIAHRIRRAVVAAHFEMNMRPCSAPTRSHRGDHSPFFHVLPFADHQRLAVAV